MMLLILVLLGLFVSSPAWAVCNQLSTSYIPNMTTAIPTVARNTVFYAPEYCTKMVRVTDATDGEGATILDVQFPALNLDNTRLFIQVYSGPHNGFQIYTFNPTTMQSSWLAAQDATGGCRSGYGTWDFRSATKNSWLCMHATADDAHRRITSTDYTTGTPSTTSDITGGALLTALLITGTVNTAPSSTCVTINFTPFDNVDGQYVGMNLKVGSNSYQAITTYTASTKQACVGSTPGVAFAPGQAVTISPTGIGGGNMFGASVDGSMLCFSVGDGNPNRGSSGGRILGAYYPNTGVVKIHWMSYAEIVGTGGGSMVNQILGGVHAGLPSKDGSACQITIEGQTMYNSTFWLWYPLNANPTPATGDGQILGPSGPLISSGPQVSYYSHPSAATDRTYSINGQDSTGIIQNVWSSLSSKATIFTLPLKNAVAWPANTDQYNTAQQRQDGLNNMITMWEASCTGLWTNISAAKYSSAAYPAGCTGMSPLTSANQPLVYHNGQLMTKVGGDSNTQAQCVTAVVGAGQWCWNSTDSKIVAWLFNSQDPANQAATTSLTISSGSNTTACFSSGSAVDGFYVGRLVSLPLTNGSSTYIYGALRQITAYVGATKCATFRAIENSDTPLNASTAFIWGNSIVAWDSRQYLQCMTQFYHNLGTDAVKTRVVDCPKNVVPAANMTADGTMYGNMGFYYEFDMTISNDGCFMAARIPWTAERTDVFIYNICQFTPPVTNTLAASNLQAASNVKATTITGDQGYVPRP